jgi:hypothetical protein
MMHVFLLLTEKPELPLTIEIHASYWHDMFMKYECRDLCAGGRIYDNIDEFDLPEKIKNAVKCGFYNVLPVDPMWFYTHETLQGYCVVFDTDDGMRIMKHKKAIPSDNKDKTGRFLTEA